MIKTPDLASPIILSLETALLGGSVFLGSGRKELAARTGDPGISHSNTLLTDIRESLDEAGLALKDIDVFACASGPGSFTGLRIGLSTLKALASTLGRPCAGVPTLQAVAHAAGPSPATVALLPAGRGELFAQMFSVSIEGEVTELDSAAHLSPSRVTVKYEDRVSLLWAGEGAHSQRESLQAFARDRGIEFGAATGGWRLAPKTDNLAKHVAEIALQMYQRRQLNSAAALKAIYVRPSDAELNATCQ
jgi:tRNA threonylcarbamoyladenosine biosynthesis protein TsaB